MYCFWLYKNNLIFKLSQKKKKSSRNNIGIEYMAYEMTVNKFSDWRYESVETVIKLDCSRMKCLECCRYIIPKRLPPWNEDYKKKKCVHYGKRLDSYSLVPCFVPYLIVMKVI